MLRNRNLVPLSHQHQHALALCVRLERAPKSSAAELVMWNQEIDHLFLYEIRFHFEAEERWVFPEAIKYPEMAVLVNELLGEHGLLRGHFERASRGELAAPDLSAFAARLSEHVRKEEKQLFEKCQQLMHAEELARIGAAMDEYFHTMPGASCTFEQ